MRVLLVALATLLGASMASAQQLPTEVVDTFHQTLESGDANAVRGFLSPDVVVYELGKVETPLDVYAAGGLPTHMAFAAGTDWVVGTRRTGGSGDQRWVVSTYQVTGLDAAAQTINTTYLETMFLTRIDGEFRITHIHWSKPTPTAATGAAPAPAPVAP